MEIAFLVPFSPQRILGKESYPGLSGAFDNPPDKLRELFAS
jgi:hypothetical protein